MSGQQLSEDLRELRKWLNEEPNRPIDRVALARVLFSHEASPQTGQKSVASDLRDALAGCLSLLQCHEHPLRRGAMMPEPQCMLDARAALAAHEAAPQEPVAWLYEAWFQDQGEGGDDRWMPEASPYKPEESERTRNIRPLYAAPQQAQAPGWQPIETAPKDGTEFWGWRPHGRVQQGVAYRVPRDDCEMWHFAGSSAAVDIAPDLKPTHWMSLPAAPQQGSKT